MAQQHHQQYQSPQRPYSPLPRTESPHHGLPNPYPPVKRQALSPNNQSPYGSPSMANIQLPNQVFSAPYYGAPNGSTPYSSYPPNNPYGSQAPASSNSNRPYNSQSYHANLPYSSSNIYGTTGINGNSSNYNTMNTSQPPPPPSQSVRIGGGMGPPARPDDKPTDINELGDVMVGSGIDLREEEAALLSSYAKAGQQGAGHGANAFNNFGPSYVPSRDNFYSHHAPGDRNSFYGAGTFNQPPATDQSAEEIAAEKLKRSNRRRAEIRSYHLNTPFLSSGSIHRRLITQTHRMQVDIPKAGLLKSQPGHAPRQIALQGPDKNEVLKVVQGEDLLQPDAPLIEILALISLAAEERIRGFVEDAATLAKGRRIGSHGVVPADLADFATADSEKVTGLPTPSDSAVSPNTNLLKRSYSEVSGNPMAQALQKIARTERAQEEERLAKRQRRLAGGTNKTGSAASGTPGSSGSLGEMAPEIDVKKGGKAKDKMDATARKAAETQQHAATTKTMNMALGLSGAMGKKLSWMKGGGDTAPSNPFLPKRDTMASQVSKANMPTSNGIGSTLPKVRLFGEFREDKETGAGIQLRDIVSVLENDGKAKKALQRAYPRFGKQNS